MEFTRAAIILFRSIIIMTRQLRIKLIIGKGSLKCMHTTMFYCQYFKVEQLVSLPVSFPNKQNPFNRGQLLKERICSSQKGSTLKEKKFLLEEQIPKGKNLLLSKGVYS